mmetsp:Transcript_51354/g.128884  ORF Transcript_51354/g.128884 Transcript_51354/m.128884 type:complete len:146 (-) Transcript_51354:139-576(-)
MVNLRDIGCVLAGCIAAVAWWIFIDGAAYGINVDKATSKMEWYYFLPGIISTVGLILMNIVNLKDAIEDEDDWEGSGSRTSRVRVWLFITFTILFCCVGGGIWIMAAHFPDNWTGVAILLQPILLMFSATFLLFVRRFGESYEYA